MAAAGVEVLDKEVDAAEVKLKDEVMAKQIVDVEQAVEAVDVLKLKEMLVEQTAKLIVDVEVDQAVKEKEVVKVKHKEWMAEQTAKMIVDV